MYGYEAKRRALLYLWETVSQHLKRTENRLSNGIFDTYEYYAIDQMCTSSITRSSSVFFRLMFR